MSVRMEEDGYHVNRFPAGVSQDLLCSICHNVSKDARLCQNHDHFFCFAHISRYLQRSKTCPVCRQELTPETLRRPTGFIKNHLDGLIINCNYHDRGCPEQVRLESLQNHVDQCGFAPALCQNERCGNEINKRDKEVHEKDFCQFRFARCHECRDIKASQDQLNASQAEIQDGHGVIMNQLNEIMASQENKRSIQDALKETKDEMNAGLEQLTDEMNAKQEQLRDGMNAGLEQLRNEMNGRLEQLGAEMNARLGQIYTGLKQIRPCQNEMGEQTKANRDEELKQVKRKQNEVATKMKKLKVVPYWKNIYPGPQKRPPRPKVEVIQSAPK